MTKNPAGFHIIDIRDQRLRGERLTISSRTRSAPEFRRREAAVRTLLGRGELELVERLRDRSDPLRIEELQRAVEAGDIDSLRRRDRQPLTLGEGTKRLLQHVEATWSAGTLKQYRIVVEMLLQEFGADAPLPLASEEVREWLQAPKETTKGKKPWARARQQLALAIVGRLHNLEIRRDEEIAARTDAPRRITHNPVRNIELPQKRPTRVEFLRPEEWLHLAGKVEDRPQSAFLALGCLAGLRISETAHLRPDIDLVLDGERPRIEVQPREGEYSWRPKTRRSIRTIPLAPFPDLLGILRRHRELGFAGERYFIRVPERDAPVSRQVLARWTARAFKAAGIRYGRERDALTYHSLRHSFISWLVQADYSLMKIEKLSGTSVKMIIEVYGHLIDEDLDQGMALLAAKLQKAA